MRYIKQILPFSAVMAVTLSSLSIMPLNSVRAAQNTLSNGRIAFETCREVDCEIYGIDSNGSNEAAITADSLDQEKPDWSPDGTKIAVEGPLNGDYDNYDIFVLNADGSNITPLTESTTDDFSPDWSPDGTKIVFESIRDGNNEIYVMNADGSNEIRLTTDASIDEKPSWSPDGTKILFNSYRTGDSEIYVMNADGSNASALTNNADSDIDAVWSPDGTTIAFAVLTVGSDFNIYAMDADGSNVRALTNVNDSYYPAWSPDGTKIAFISTRDGNGEIYVMNADGSNEIRLTTDAGWDTHPTWQPIITTTPDQTTDSNGNISTTINDGEDFSSLNYTVVDKETLLVNGDLGAVTVGSGGLLKGNGSVGTLTVNSGGSYAPGNSPGCMNTSNLTMTAGSNYDVEIGGTVACTGYDQTVVTGTVDITDASLSVSLVGSFVPNVDDSFTIILNDANDAVTGAFAGLAEGATTKIGAVTYRVSYVGGTGNDVTLTVTAVDTAALAPTAPNTGLSLITANPWATLGLTTLAATFLYLLARKNGIIKYNR